MAFFEALEEHCRGAEQASTFCCEGRGSIGSMGCSVNLVIGAVCHSDFDCQSSQSGGPTVFLVLTAFQLLFLFWYLV